MVTEVLSLDLKTGIILCVFHLEHKLPLRTYASCEKVVDKENKGKAQFFNMTGAVLLIPLLYSG